MFRERARTLQGVSLLLDVFCICLAFGAAFVLRVFHDSIPIAGTIPAEPWNAEKFVRSDYAVLLVVSLLGWVASLRASGVYLSHRSERYDTILLTYLRALVMAALATGAATFVLKMGSISRVYFGYYFALAFLFLVAKQSMVIAALRQLRRTGFNQRHVVIIGSGKPASWFSRILMDAKQTGYNLVGLLLTRKVMSAETVEVPVIGMIDDLDEVLTNNPVDEVFIVGGAEEIASLAPVAQDLITKGRVVSLVSTLASSTDGVRGRVTEFSGVPVISFGPMPHDPVFSLAKRSIDVVVASVGLIVFSPLMLAIWALMKLLDPGPVLFAQERLGVGGQRFCLYKFRSMRTDAEQVLTSDPALYRRYVENDYKLPEDEDPRISSLGRFLRKSSLDELPQLWNVLRGEMTLVGPRPIVPAEIEKYEPYADLFLSVRPGVTGHWQVSGRSDVQYPDRAFMDLDYVGWHSLASDFSIIARTVPAVLLRKGAH